MSNYSSTQPTFLYRVCNTYIQVSNVATSHFLFTNLSI